MDPYPVTRGLLTTHNAWLELSVEVDQRTTLKIAELLQRGLLKIRLLDERDTATA